ncbi:MAG: FAD-binding and (Fe-S)-binding domain-containing protein [Idiomarina sp.]
MTANTTVKALPRHHTLAALQLVYQDYLQALQESAFQGDIDSSYGARLIAGTDNSVYQTLPQAIIYPKTEHDLQEAMKIASAAAFQDVAFSPRGGGTGTNGQSLTQGIVVDLSRYFTEVLEINAEEGWARVQTGVVKDRLNDALAPYGWFFSPDLSTSNRATIGGMINTDASGQGSLVYGKTSDHIAGLNTVLLNGELLSTSKLAKQQAEAIASEDTAIGRIYRQVIDSCVQQRAAIEAKFPPLNRFLTGYDLKHAYEPSDDTVDVSRLLAGSEGTLGFITEAKLTLTRIPRHKVLVNVKYNDFQSALEHAPFLVKARATSVETIDSSVLNLARNDIIWDSVAPHLSDVDGQTMNGINMVEFTAVDASEIEDKVNRLSEMLDQFIADNPAAGVIGYQVCREQASIKTIYAMRKKAVGLLGATKGSRKPVAFAEDTAVPPEKLASFITEFRQLLDDHELHYGMFGHVDAGVLHVRPALDLKNPDDEVLLRKISDQVAALTAKYGGLMWGEHGKGYRSEYAPAFFGDALFNELRKIKACFDPHNRLNPGKICTPANRNDSLVSVDATKRGSFDRQIPVQVQTEFQQAMDCNGNGLCFNYDTSSAMCPSFKMSAERRYSPKGRAGLIREWLRLNEQAGYDSGVLPYAQSTSVGWFKKIGNSWSTQPDFNHEVKESMDKCLACKACASQCPVKVDVPSFRAKFLAHYHSRYARPLKDYFVKTVEQTAPLMAKAPRLSNAISHNPLSQWLLRKLVGYVDAPEQSVPSLTQRFSERNWPVYTPKQLLALGDDQQEGCVVIVQDAFTSFYEANLVEDFAELVTRLGFKPVLLSFIGNGKAQHVKGFLEEFTETATAVAGQLAKLQQQGFPMVGLDASTVLCFRDEYRQFAANHATDFEVLTVDEWLLKAMPEVALGNSDNAPFILLSHCTEKTALPSSVNRWQQVFERAGINLQPVAVGCCGMAGTFGHELENKADSLHLYDLSWREVVADYGSERVLATGFSCRSQVKRIEQQRVKHPLQILADKLI